MIDRRRERASMPTFKACIAATQHLEWRPGLQAITSAEGGGQVTGQDPGSLLGGAAIDTDSRALHPNASRWDYVIGYARASGAHAYFIEVHSAETTDVSVVEKKLKWLLDDYLRADSQQALAKLPRELHWVASGRINIPQHLPQYRKLQTTLRKRGLRGPVKQLTLT
jgi:hypothetical protein